MTNETRATTERSIAIIGMTIKGGWATPRNPQRVQPESSMFLFDGGETVTTQPKTRTILIVDDHPVVRKGMRLVIENQTPFRISGEAQNAATAMAALRKQTPDLVIVDISLGQGSGIELIKQIVASHPHTKILVHSLHEEEIYASRTVRAGARGYVNKDQPVEQLIEAIHTVIQGQLHFSPSILQQLLSRGTGHRNVAASSDPFEALTDRELEIFELIGNGRSLSEIANTLHLSPKTVETYRNRMKSKLHVQTIAELNRKAMYWNLDQ